MDSKSNIIGKDVNNLYSKKVI